MKDLERVELVRCKECGFLYGAELKHKCSNERVAAYRQGKKDAVIEFATRLEKHFEQMRLSKNIYKLLVFAIHTIADEMLKRKNASKMEDKENE